MSDIDKILEERGQQYGGFYEHAIITQGIKSVMKVHGNFDDLPPEQKEALELIAHKIGRIVNGNPNHKDSWDDIAGYAILVSNILKEKLTNEDKLNERN